MIHFVVPKNPVVFSDMSRRRRRQVIPYVEIINGTLCTDGNRIHNKLEQAKNYHDVPGGVQDLQPTVEHISSRLNGRTGLVGFVNQSST